MNRRWRYFEDSDNYFQLALYLSTVIFIFGFSDECWCSTPWQWQIGAFAVFLSWLNFIFILKYMPYTAVPINMFLSICVTFLKLIFLPIVLILAFGVPHYMVFVRTTSSSEVSCWCNHWTCCTSIISLVTVLLARNKACEKRRRRHMHQTNWIFEQNAPSPLSPESSVQSGWRGIENFLELT